ncbi:MAG: hypothetical protein V2I33_19635 [Kangiellaceae bacterium]|nr:hypothetical protein [Kangiellaceae bacterium]
MPVEWTFCGAHNSHTKRINAISFGVDVKTNELRLFSVADDRTMVEYDTNSVEETQL